MSLKTTTKKVKFSENNCHDRTSLKNEEGKQEITNFAKLILPFR